MPLVRANLPNSKEDLDDSEVGLTYQTPAELESYEKQREILEEIFREITNQTLITLPRVQDIIGTNSPLAHTASHMKMRSVKYRRHKIAAGTQCYL